PNREAATYDLAPGDEVGLQPEPLHGATRRQPEAGHDLIDDEQRARLTGQLPQPLEETDLRWHDAHVAGDGLDEHGSDLRAPMLEQTLDAAEVVVTGHEGVPRHVRWNTRATGYPGREGAGAGCYEERIGMPVVVPLELDEGVPAGSGPRDAQGAHRRLGAGVDEPHHLACRVLVQHQLRQLNLAGARRPEACPFVKRLDGRFQHARV